MSYFIVTMVVLALFFVLMSVGVLLGNNPLKGSCGGLGALMGKDCDICGERDKCEKRKKSKAS